MPTDVVRNAIVVFGGTRGPGWLAARSARALRAHGVTVDLVAEHRLASQLEGRAGALLVLRDGAVPIAPPREPSKMPSTLPFAAFGATFGAPGWTTATSEVGRDLAKLPAGKMPRLDALYVDDAAVLASVVQREQLTRLDDIAAHLLARASGGGGVVVHEPSLDVSRSEAPHVLEVVTTLHRGGAERVVLDLATSLDSLGIDVTVAVTDRPTRSTFDAPRGTIKLYELATERRERLDVLASLAAKRGVDLVHAHLLDGDELRVLAASSIPLVTTIHNARPGWPARLETLREGDVALVIACSREVERELLDARIPSPVRTAWNGIRIAPAPPPHERKPGTLRLLTVANHRAQKRLERLPAVVAQLRARGIDASLRVVGEPVRADPSSLAIADAFTAAAREHGVEGHVELAGSVADVQPVYAGADAVVCVSSFEGLSLVHLEALAAHVPLVTTNVSGTEELAMKHAELRTLPWDVGPSGVADAVLAVTSRNERNERNESNEAPGAEGTPAHGGLAEDFSAARMAERHAELFARVVVQEGLPSRRASTKPSLVLVTNNLSTGGAQSSARRLLLGLAARGVDVTAVVIEEQPDYPTPGRTALVEAGIEVLVAPRAGSVDPLETARAVATMVDLRRSDALLLWNVIPEHKVLVADLVRGVPVRDVSPGEMYFASFERYLTKPRVGSPYLTMRDYGRRLAGAVVKYTSERDRAASALGVPVTVIPNGVPIPATTSRRVRRPGEPAVVIGTLARIGPDKKLEQLVDAVVFLHAAGRFESCELRIAGAPETGEDAYATMLRERARGLSVVWTGERESASFLEGLDFFVMVAEPSGCPNASLEAMAAGLAVVATDAGGVREQVEDGVNGLVVPRGDHVALAEAMASLAGDEARRHAMGDRGRERAQAHFGIERMVRDYAALCGLALGSELPDE